MLSPPLGMVDERCLAHWFGDQARSCPSEVSWQMKAAAPSLMPRAFVSSRRPFVLCLWPGACA